MIDNINNCLSKTEMIGYKKICNESYHDNLIAELEIQGINNCARTGVVDSNYAKFRCSQVKVLSIKHMFTGEEQQVGWSMYDNKFMYTVGEIITIQDYQIDDEICADKGIHFFKTYDAAYYYYNGIFTNFWPNFIKEWNFFNDNGVLIQKREFEKK